MIKKCPSLVLPLVYVVFHLANGHLHRCVYVYVGNINHLPIMVHVTLHQSSSKNSRFFDQSFNYNDNVKPIEMR